MRDSPCPVDPVAARAPVAAAPQAIPTASSSLSALMQAPPSVSGRLSRVILTRGLRPGRDPEDGASRYEPRGPDVREAG